MPVSEVCMECIKEKALLLKTSIKQNGRVSISPFYIMLLLPIISACKRKPFLMNGFLQSNWKWTITNLFIYSCFFPFQCIFPPSGPILPPLCLDPLLFALMGCHIENFTLFHCYIVGSWLLQLCNSSIVCAWAATRADQHKGAFVDVRPWGRGVGQALQSQVWPIVFLNFVKHIS